MEMPTHMFIALRHIRINDLEPKTRQKLDLALGSLDYPHKFSGEESVAVLTDVLATKRGSKDKKEKKALAAIETIVMSAAMMHL